MTTGETIYLDYAATTPVYPEVVERMTACLNDPALAANPSSSHAAGRRAAECIETARGQVAGCLNADPREIVFTSGATEADNMAVKGGARFHRRRGGHVITSVTEHKAVTESCRQLEREGFEVTRLRPRPDGRIGAEQVAGALRDDTALVSIMHVNNETGTINPVAEIAAALEGRRVLFHVDAAQSVGRLAVDVQALGADLVSLSAHKAGGPKGVGALWLRGRPAARIEPIIQGGGHERGLRSGTPATHQIVGMAEAFRVAESLRESEYERIGALAGELRERLKAPGAVFDNGDPAVGVPHIVNLAFDGIGGESLLALIPEIAVAGGSACMTAAAEPSYVLRALGRSPRLAEASLRFSLGRYTTGADIARAGERVNAAVTHLRRISPLDVA